MNYTIVIFGGNGDLTYRKLLPALYNLSHDGILTDRFAVVGVGRRDYTQEQYHQDVYDALSKFSRFQVDKTLWNKLKQNIYYRSMDFTNQANYKGLDEYLSEIDQKYQTESKRIYYFAVAPEYFEVIAENLHAENMHSFNEDWPKIVIEKPFGRDLKSAQYLNKILVSRFTEKNTYRIDHYLGKEMLQNIMVIRFANRMFEPLWNNKHIEQVQITSAETIGIGTRGEYFEKSGAIRDMAQSHLLQLLCLIAMEQPKSLNSEDIKDAKVNVLKSLKKLTKDDIDSSVALGQYEGYREEPKVRPTSNIETYVAFKAMVENERWKGVPFYIRTGKKLPVKTTEIVIEFKKQDNGLYGPLDSPNYLVIRIQPKEGVFFQFNAKMPGTIQKIVPVQMDFCQNCTIGLNSPEAYERLFYDITRGDSTLFARWDEVEQSWIFIDDIIQYRRDSKPLFPNYKPGEWGPKKADEILAQEHHTWVNFEE